MMSPASGIVSWALDNATDTSSVASANATDPSMIQSLQPTVEQDRWVLVVDEVILVGTIIGAIMILASMAYLEFKGRPSTTRVRIVQSLVISDLSLGIVGAIGVSKALGNNLKPGASCDGLGVVLIATIWSEHMWTLTLAFATYMILIYPLHYITTWLEKRWWCLWLAVWALSIGLSVMGYEIYGVVPSGGICYYPPSSGLFADLIQFIPRGIVFVTISILYARLFVFLRRPDKIRSPYSDSPTSNSYTRRSSPFGLDSLKQHRLPRMFRSKRRSKAKGPPQEAPEFSSPAWEPMSEVPPWEKVELPTFQIDGRTYGGSSARSPSGPSKKWKMPKRASTGTRQFGSMSSTGSDARARPMLPVEYGVPPSLITTPIYEDPPEDSPFGPDEMPRFDSLGPEQDGRRGSAVTGSSSGSNGTATVPSVTSSRPVPRPSLSEQGTGSGSGSSADFGRKLSEPEVEKIDLGDVENAEEHEEEDDEEELDLMKVLKTTAPPKSQVDDFAPREGDNVELVEESMASYLNRKVSLLMLWFPLGYILLFSVSLIRIIYDFVGRPPTVLRALSRWFIFAQGVLDAVIYGLVEWHTKRVIRRKVRKRGMSSHTSSPMGQHGSGSWPHGYAPSGRGPTSPKSRDTPRIGSIVHPGSPVSQRSTLHASSIDHGHGRNRVSSNGSIEMAQTSRRGSHIPSEFSVESHATFPARPHPGSVTSSSPLERTILQELVPDELGRERRTSVVSFREPKPG